MNGFTAQILAAIVANLMMLSTGMISIWSASALPKLLAIDSDLPLTSDQGSWAVSLNSLGAVFGPLIVVLLADRVGRKWTLYITVMPMLASWVMIGLAKNYQLLYVGRFVGGLGVGAVYGTLPMYLGEIADDKIRGALGTLISSMASAGAVAVSSIGPWISRQMIAVMSSIPIVIFIIAFFWMPESPYYQLMKGKRKAAKSSLVWFRRRMDVEEELVRIEKDVHLQQQNKAGILKLVTNLGNRRALFIAFGMVTIQQFCGCSALVSYSSLIFAQSGSSISSDNSVMIMTFVAMLAGILAGCIVDIAGRRLILLFTMIGVFLSLMAEAVFCHLQELGQDVSGFTWLPLVGILSFVLMFIIGPGTLRYIIISEVFPMDVKALANTVLSMYTSVGEMIVIKLYQVVGDAFGRHVAYYGFAACTALGTVFVYFCVPETKGCSLQNIQHKLNRGKDSTDDYQKYST